MSISGTKQSEEEDSVPLLSVVTPAFNESENIRALHDQLRSTLSDNHIKWEWIIVDDHSLDDSFLIIQSLAAKHQNIRGVRLAQNAGSHMALACGIELARGECTVVIAGDLQDPPQLIPELMEPMGKVLVQVPDLQVVLCHAGSPYGRSPDGIAKWAAGLAHLSALPNVSCKLSLHHQLHLRMPSVSIDGDTLLPLCTTLHSQFSKRSGPCHL